MNVAPTLFTSCNSLPPEGAHFSLGRPGGKTWPRRWILPPRSLASRNSLPPEGAAAPAVWQSQSRGPCLKGASTSYPLSLRERAGVRALRLRYCPHGRSLRVAPSPPEGAAAPAARRSRFRGPCLKGASTSCSLSLRERAGASRCGSRSACALLDSVEKAGLRPDCGLQDRAALAPASLPPSFAARTTHSNSIEITRTRHGTRSGQ